MQIEGANIFTAVYSFASASAHKSHIFMAGTWICVSVWRICLSAKGRIFLCLQGNIIGKKPREIKKNDWLFPSFHQLRSPSGAENQSGVRVLSVEHCSLGNISTDFNTAGGGGGGEDGVQKQTGAWGWIEELTDRETERESKDGQIEKVRETFQSFFFIIISLYTSFSPVVGRREGTLRTCTVVDLLMLPSSILLWCSTLVFFSCKWWWFSSMNSKSRFLNPCS